MLVFIDESGDAGTKLDRGSSELFVMALVVFADHQEAQRCVEAIASLRSERGLSKDFEFHYAENSARQREGFLQTIQEFAFHSHVLAVDKRRLVELRGVVGESLYMWTLRETLEFAKASLTDAQVVIDGAGSRHFRRSLAGQLRESQVTGERIIRAVRLQPSHQNSLLQLADYVASISARALREKADGERFRGAYLRHKERSFRIVPDE